MSQQGAPDSEPLAHFLRSKPGEFLTPNWLFDPQYYLDENSDEAPLHSNPLIDFVLYGAFKGYRCHPLFDADFYLNQYPDVREAGANPLVHYFEHGRHEGRATTETVDINAYRKDASKPLASYGQDVARSRVEAACLFVVYGERHVPFLKDVLLPSLRRCSRSRPVHVHALNYANCNALMDGVVSSGSVQITDWSSSRMGGSIGFGEAHNYLFNKVRPKDCFIIVNPDSCPLQGCLDRMFDTYERTSAGIVEARQWPQAHPKEFDRTTGNTPWASGACSLIDAEVFAKIQGFDPLFYLYNEDVDLSWRVWLAGRRVVHEPKAFWAHFTGLFSYQPDRLYHEHFYSSRNYILLARKFFGEEGEQKAISALNASSFPDTFKREVVESYESIKGKIKSFGPVNHEMIKILGMNVYHRLQTRTALRVVRAESSSVRESHAQVG